MTDLPERVYLLRWKVHNTMGEATRRGQFISKSEKRALVRKKLRGQDPNCYDVELYTAPVLWRFMD